MRKTVILFLLLSATILQAQSLESVYRQILLNNIQLKQVDLSAQEARRNYSAAMEDVLPDFSFTTDGAFSPLYGYSVSDVYSLVGAPVRTVENSFGGDLKATQSLPTGGSLSLGVNSVGSYGGPESGDWDFEQSTGFSVSISQPLFVNGQFIDPSLLSTSLELSSMALKSAEYDILLLEESLFSQLLSVVAQYRLIQLGSDLLNVNASLAGELLRQAEQDFQLGRGSQTDVIERSYTVRSLNEQAINFDLQKLKLVQLFKHLSGVDIESDTLEILAQEVELLIPEIISQAPLEPDYMVNPDVVKLEDSLRSLELSGRLNDLSDAPVLGATFSYDTADGSGDDFGAAFSDSFEGDPNWSINVFFQWRDFARSSSRKANDTLSLQLQRLELQRQSLLKNLSDNYEAKVLELNILQKTEDLLKASLANDLDRLGREKVRFEAGSGSSLLLKQLEADVRDREIKIKENNWRQLQIHLEIFALSGKAVARDVFNISSSD